MTREKYNVFPYQTADPVYYAQLKEWARENRAHPTEAENILRQYVRGNRLGHKFLYQHIIGQYIVDFLCPDSRLVVEVDGAYHAEPEQSYDDGMRTQWLEKVGYKVIRFTNEEVYNDIDNVLDIISNHLE